MSVLLKTIEKPDAHLYDDVFREYIRLLRISPEYHAHVKELKLRRDVLERELKPCTVRKPLGMSQHAGSMRHQASIPQEAWNAHEKLWPDMSTKDRAENFKRHLPECFF